MPRSLNILLMTPIMLVLVGGLILSSLGLYYGLNRMMYANLQQKVSLTESFLLKVTPELMWNFDTDAMATYSHDLMKDKEFVSLVFLNEKGDDFLKGNEENQASLPADAFATHDIVVDGAKIGSFRLGYSYSVIHQNLKWLLISVIAGMFVAVGLLLFVISNVVKRATRPIINLAAIFGKATDESDLTVAIPVDKSKEVGLLGRSLNQFSRRIRETLYEVQGMGRTVKEHATAIGSITGRVTTLVDSQRQASEEINLAVRESSSTLHELNNLTQQAASQLNQMVGMAAETNTVMGKLDATSNEIQSVLEVITSIAASTNLLALNAAIEAARAGEAGKGFAVVADEVKKLSTKTMESTSQISATIEMLKSDTSAMQQQVATMSNSIHDVQQHIQNVALATQRQSATMEEVSSTIGGFLGQFDTTRQAMKDSNARLGSLQHQVDELDNHVKVFKV